jgi:hypothetical protein
MTDIRPEGSDQSPEARSAEKPSERMIADPAGKHVAERRTGSSGNAHVVSRGDLAVGEVDAIAL